MCGARSVAVMNVNSERNVSEDSGRYVLVLYMYVRAVTADAAARRARITNTEQKE